MPTSARAGTASFLLLHGAATTGAIWAGVRRELGERPVLAPDRPSCGDLDREVAALRAAVEEVSGAAGAGPVVFGGVSGGATLGLAALAAGVPLAAAVLHEPAVGSLLPGLLAPMAAAFESGGVTAFGRALYGASWRPSDAPADPGAVGRDLAMFLRFEPAMPRPTPGPVVITVGERSPQARYRAAEVLRRELGLPVRVLPGCGHAAHLEAPGAFAALLLETAGALG
ncbi:alpha/beta hydrolase [Frankia sp. CNm7]|uniref:Alpha/beta hydrolase n=1 Tax=Frankia nepalensis TaxID=1836974 RepID=A0A937RS44_9ACTN|nr:alpha/beta hydrolase [Frankia nepalensis]MBL7494787.1 alpha/beta hydrolase [Frankia nepalensis]MBL7514339.1 alpha/beta hydrolase [Frankia nepalensis]MBL7517244.1 alpha/beta hydrolase [Frankia nepalensis]MBL7631733.1 alpha/beta hydrolase [Frankia nepalensis]